MKNDRVGVFQEHIITSRIAQNNLKYLCCTYFIFYGNKNLDARVAFILNAIGEKKSVSSHLSTI